MAKKIIYPSSEIQEQFDEVLRDIPHPNKYIPAELKKKKLRASDFMKPMKIVNGKEVVDRGKIIKGDHENKGKLESLIEKEICAYLETIPNCAYWPIKNKGQLKSTGKNTAIIAESENPGFQDITCCIGGLFVALEVKSPGKYQTPHQIIQEEVVTKKGKGYYFIVTSVRETKLYLINNGIIKLTA